MKKLKGCRPLDDINTEYSITCGMLGDKSFRRLQLQRDIEKHTVRLRELDLEAAHARAQEQEAKAQEAKSMAAAQSPPTDKDGNEYVECTTDECKAAEATA